MTYTIYDPSTGQILELVSISNPDMIDIILQDKSYVPGHVDATRYYIDQGQAMALPDRPATGLQYEFDWATKTWLVDSDYSSVVYRQQRNDLLAAVDRVNPIRYAALTSQQQTELIAYRQALLDVPQQTGWPTAIEWPAKPTWL